MIQYDLIGKLDKNCAYHPIKFFALLQILTINMFIFCMQLKFLYSSERSNTVLARYYVNFTSVIINITRHPFLFFYV